MCYFRCFSRYIDVFCNVKKDKFRSSYRRCSVRKGVPRNFAKFTGKNLCQSLFFNKVAGRPATLLKKRLWHRFFPVNLAKFLRTLFLQNTPGWLLLQIYWVDTIWPMTFNGFVFRGSLLQFVTFRNFIV